MLRNKANLVLLALAIPAMALTGCGKKANIITVNGESVSKDEFYARLERVPVQTQQGNKMAGQYVIEQIIADKLVQQLAKKDKVEPTPEQIDSKVKIIAKAAGGDINTVLKNQDMTLEELKKKIAAEQSLVNLVSKGATVTDAEVKQTYDQTLAAKNSPLRRPAQVKISVIVTAKKDKIDAAYKALSSGTDFGVVAAQYSEVPGAKQSKGATNNWLAKEDTAIPQIVRDNAFKLASGQYSKPFQATGSWVILKTDETRPVKITPFEDVSLLIKEQLAMRKGAQTSTFQSDLRSFTKDANIVVTSSRYKGIPDMIKKQVTSLELPKPGATNTGTTTAKP